MRQDIPSPFEIDEIDFRGRFRAPSLGIFKALLMNWILTVGLHTVSRLIPAMGPALTERFSSVYGFLRRGEWRNR